MKGSPHIYKKKKEEGRGVSEHTEANTEAKPGLLYLNDQRIKRSQKKMKK